MVTFLGYSTLEVSFRRKIQQNLQEPLLCYIQHQHNSKQTFFFQTFHDTWRDWFGEGPFRRGREGEEGEISIEKVTLMFYYSGSGISDGGASWKVPSLDYQLNFRFHVHFLPISMIFFLCVAVYFSFTSICISRTASSPYFVGSDLFFSSLISLFDILPLSSAIIRIFPSFLLYPFPSLPFLPP